MKAYLILAGALVFSINLHAQTAAQLISTGRGYLAAKDLTNAYAKFFAAVTVNAEHEQANFFLGITRLLRTVNQSPAQAFMDRHGLPATNRNIYSWSAIPAMDTNGNVVVPNGVSTSETPAFYRAHLLPQIIAAEANLARITNINFSVSLSAAETAIAAVTVDYGDILLLRSMLRAAEYAGYTAGQWDVEMQLSALRALVLDPSTTAESIRAQFPQLFTVVNSSELPQARTALVAAADLYSRASEAIRGRAPAVIRLFNLAYADLDDESRFRATVSDLIRSTTNAVTLTHFPQFKANLGTYFSGAILSRSSLPDFHEDAVVAGTLPDSSFGGIISGLTRMAFDEEAARHVKYVSRFETIPTPAPGLVVHRFHTVAGPYALQTSMDLTNWTDVSLFYSYGGAYEFLGESSDTGSRFYRLEDLSRDYLHVHGSVQHVCSEAPIPQAPLRVTGYTAAGETNLGTVYTDGRGEYHLPTRLRQDEVWNVYVFSEVPGYYDEARSSWEGKIDFNLYPIGGSTPANSSFETRLVISGFPYSYQDSACAGRRWWSIAPGSSGFVSLGIDQALWDFGAYQINAWGDLEWIDLFWTADGLGFHAEAGITYAFYVETESGASLQVSMPPRVIVSTPTADQRIVLPDPLVVTASVFSSIAPVERVEFFAGSRLIGRDDTAPYQCVWQNPRLGVHTITVRAYDTLGQSSASKIFNVHVCPTNDVFSRRFAITSLPAVVDASTRYATADDNDPFWFDRSLWWELDLAGRVGVEIVKTPWTELFAGIGTPEDFWQVDEQDVPIDELNARRVFQAERGTRYQLVAGTEWWLPSALHKVEFELRPFPNYPVVTSGPAAARLAVPATVSFGGQPSPSDTNIVQFALNIDGVIRAAVSNGPLAFTWTNVPIGTYTFSFIATDASGFVTESAPRTFAVQLPWPANDDFANATAITSFPNTQNGWNTNATEEHDEPQPDGAFGGASVWWSWTASHSGPVVLSTGGSSFDTLLAVWTGDSLEGLELVASDDDSGPAFTSRVAFMAQQGVTYRIAVDGWLGATGAITLSLGAP